MTRVLVVLRDMGKKSANPGNSLGHDVRTVVQPSPSPFFQILQDPESSPSAPSSPPLFLDSRALIITAAVCWATSEVLSIGQIHLILKMLQCSEAAGVPILPVAKAGLRVMTNLTSISHSWEMSEPGFHSRSSQWQSRCRFHHIIWSRCDFLTRKTEFRGGNVST